MSKNIAKESNLVMGVILSSSQQRRDHHQLPQGPATERQRLAHPRS